MYMHPIQEHPNTLKTTTTKNKKQKLLEDVKEETDSNTVTVGYFNTILSPLDKSSKQKISKETSILNDSLDQMELIDIFKTFHPKPTEYTFFSSAHGSFSKICHILGHRQSLFKLNKVAIVSSIFSDHSGIKREINYNKNNPKKSNTWRLNSMLLNNDWATRDIKKEIKSIMATNDNENTTIQIYGTQ